jgi:[glutamine synthetase] adenylyltransferase / [glutamine synthetase]-adenylyl-L-tyrosine phosphorylase
VPGGASLIVALGKLGGQEMTAGSDLDLMLIYHHDAEAMSDGTRPISAPQYYARLTQRLITAITAPTSEGVLYDVDMRLRPSGSMGPVAVSLSSFDSYQRDSAWTWEKLALTRARIVSGPESLQIKARAIIAQTLCAPRDAGRTREDVRDMRGLMLREHKDQGRWDIKRKRGGLIEVEFIAQTLQLLHAQSVPTILHQNTGRALAAAAEAKIIGAKEAASLTGAFALYSRLTQILRLCLEGSYDPSIATPALNRIVCLAAQMPDLASTEALLNETAENIREIFDRVIGKPQ